MSDIGKQKRKAVWDKTGGRCWYCGIRFDERVARKRFTIDHAQPRTRDGDNEIANLLPCCHGCNVQKKTKTLEEYRMYVMRRHFGLNAFSKTQIEWLLSVGVDVQAIIRREYAEETGAELRFWAEEAGV